MLLIRNFENEKKILKEIMDRKLLQLATPDRIYSTHDLSESVNIYFVKK